MIDIKDEEQSSTKAIQSKPELHQETQPWRDPGTNGERKFRIRWHAAHVSKEIMSGKPGKRGESVWSQFIFTTTSG